MFPQPWLEKKWFFLPESNQSTYLEGGSKEYSVRSGMRGGLTIWTSDDLDCSNYAKALALSDLRRGRNTTIAGLPTVKYIEQRSLTEASQAVFGRRQKVLTLP